MLVQSFFLLLCPLSLWSSIHLLSSGLVSTCWPSALWHFQKQKAIKYKHGVCVCMCVSFFLIFPLSFDSFLVCFESYWDAWKATQSWDKLLIVDSFIKAPRCPHTWHFLTLNSHGTDTNALVSSKHVNKLGRVGGPLALKKEQASVQVLTELAWKHQQVHRRKCVCVFGFAWGNIPPDF